jgi:hypothetical protein
MKECSRCQATTKSGGQCKLTTCKLYPYCWIHLKSKDGLQVKKSTIDGAGEGLFYVGKQEFPANKNIALYSTKKVSSTPISGHYVLQVSKNKFIDSKNKQNFVGRYINSNKGTKRPPNVRFSSGRVVKKVKDRETIPIISKKKIKKGSELLLNYGKSFKL